MKEKHIDHPEMLAFGVMGVQIACIHFTARLTGFLKAGSKVCLTGMDPENEKKRERKKTTLSGPIRFGSEFNGTFRCSAHIYTVM